MSDHAAATGTTPPTAHVALEALARRLEALGQDATWLPPTEVARLVREFAATIPVAPEQADAGPDPADQPATPRAALEWFADYLTEHDFPAPMPSSVYAQLAREKAERLPDVQPEDLAHAVLLKLEGRSGFDDWWGGIDDEIQREIRADLAGAIRDQASPSTVDAGPDPDNEMLVGIRGGHVVTVMLPPREMTPERAYRHAAWLIAMADCARQDRAVDMLTPAQVLQRLERP